MLELLVGLAVISVMSAVALPSFMQSYRMYQLNDAANQVAGVLKYHSLRGYPHQCSGPVTPLKAQVLLRPAGTFIFTDSNNSGNVQPTEKQALFPRCGHPGSLLRLSPNTAGLAGLVGVPALTNISPTNGFVSFDQRGAAAPPAVSVLYIGNTALPEFGQSSRRRASHGFHTDLVNG